MTTKKPTGRERLRWHLADEEFRRTENFLRSDCAFCDLGDVAYKNW